MKLYKGNFTNPDNSKALIYGYEIVCDNCSKQLGVGTCEPIEYVRIPRSGQLCHNCREDF